MRILFLAPRFPLPADTGGKIRTLNILKQMAKMAKLHLVCFSFEEKDEEQARELKKTGIEVTLVPMREQRLVGKLSSVLFNPHPYSIAKYYTEEMEKTQAALHQSAGFDAVHIDHL